MDDVEGAMRLPEFVPGRSVWLSGIYWLDYSSGAPTHFLQKVTYRDERGIRTEITPVRPNTNHGCAQGHCEEDVFKSKANATEVHHIICCLEALVGQQYLAEGPLGKSIA